MSQNKTRFPGMENTGSNPYSRGTQVQNGDNNSRNRGTMYPGMEGSEEQALNDNQHDPVVGFLFSVSRTPYGEFWPLYLGPNKIGRGAGNSVNLPEGSVSGEHANLVIEQYTDPNVTVAVLENKGSKNGTFINGKPVFYGRTEECKNGDILRFGGSYECLLILLDIREIGLKKAENFIAVSEEETGDNWGNFNADDPYKRHDNDQPFFNPEKKGKTHISGGPAFGGSHKTEMM